MVDFQRIYHTGMAVADIHAARDQIGADLNLDWSVVRSFEPLPFWTPEDGLHEVVVHACYSRQGPQHLELVQGTGAFYEPSNQFANRHVGVWVDDLAAETERLVARGWRVLAAGAAPADGYGIIAYLMPPTGGLTVELVSTDLVPVFSEWLTADA